MRIYIDEDLASRLLATLLQRAGHHITWHSSMEPTSREENWEAFWRRRREWLLFLAILPAFVVYLGLVAIIGPDPHGTIAMVLLGPMFVVVPVWFIAHFVFLYRVMSWPCPRCGEYYCAAWWIKWPFVNSCVHCGLPMPEKPADATAPPDRSEKGLSGLE